MNYLCLLPSPPPPLPAVLHTSILCHVFAYSCPSIPASLLCSSLHPIQAWKTPLTSKNSRVRGKKGGNEMTETAVTSHDMEMWSWSVGRCKRGVEGAVGGAAEGMSQQKGCCIWAFPIRAQLL